jgi:hypothetical protein
VVDIVSCRDLTSHLKLRDLIYLYSFVVCLYLPSEHRDCSNKVTIGTYITFLFISVVPVFSDAAFSRRGPDCRMEMDTVPNLDHYQLQHRGCLLPNQGDRVKTTSTGFIWHGIGGTSGDLYSGGIFVGWTNQVSISRRWTSLDRRLNLVSTSWLGDC